MSVPKNYEIIGEYKYIPIPIGHGSFSYVYKGEHILTGKIVAIKKINITFTNNLTKEHAEQEINIMKKLKHKNIVELYESIYDQYNNIYLIMEYCENGDLASFLNKKPLKEKYVKKFMKQIASATKYLYKYKILHRDIKPQNIMMSDIKTIKLTDFGFAKIFKSDDDIMAQTICGSPIYMAPEIIKCNNYSIKTDLWSIGIILYEMIIGKPPYKAKTHLELIHKIDTEPIYIPMAILISDDCKTLIYNLLQKDPEKRISWEKFFKHSWFKYLNHDSNYNNKKFDLSELIIDYDYQHKYSNPIPINTKKNQNIICDNSTYNYSRQYKKLFRTKDDDDDDDYEDNDNKNDGQELFKDPKHDEQDSFEDSYMSPMFNAPVILTPSDKNGYIIVEQYNMNQDKIDDNMNINDIDTERTVSESFLDYMNSTVNYLKTYYWG